MDRYTRHLYTGFKPSPYELWKKLILAKLHLRRDMSALDDLHFILPTYPTQELQNLFFSTCRTCFGAAGEEIARHELSRVLTQPASGTHTVPRDGPRRHHE